MSLLCLLSPVARNGRAQRHGAGLDRRHRKVRPELRLVAGLTLAIVVLALGGCGLTAPRSNEGFADLDSLGLLDTDRVMTLSIGPALLRFAANHVDDDPETQALLRSLDGIRLRIYEIDGDADRVGGRIQRMAGRLADEGWEPVLTVRQGREQTHMLLRSDGETIAGMTVLVSDGEDEAVVINLMGDIRPEQFGGVMAALDVEAAGADEVALPDDHAG